MEGKRKTLNARTHARCGAFQLLARITPTAGSEIGLCSWLCDLAARSVITTRGAARGSAHNLRVSDRQPAAGAAGPRTYTGERSTRTERGFALNGVLWPMRLRRGPTSVVAYDASTKRWISLADAVAACGVASTRASDCLDVVTFLGLSRSTREAWQGVVSSYAQRTGDSQQQQQSLLYEGLPLYPKSFRDAGLYVRHLEQAAKGFGPVALANGHVLQLFFGQLIGKSLRLPRLVGPARKPPYYVGNALTFVPAGEARWPSHASWLDYELELALVLGATIGAMPTIGEIESAILDHGAFVVINDFSARDTQADELTSVSFGFVKSKSFCTGMASEVVTADEIWAPGDRGDLFEAGLDCTVTVNGHVWGRGTTKEQRVCSLAEYLRFAALDEGLAPGELFGLGTVPNCAGVEHGKWLAPGDVVTVECGRVGTLTHTIGSPPPDAVDFKLYGQDPSAQVSRLRTAFKLLAFAMVIPPLSFLLFLAGALAALLWPGPSTSIGASSLASRLVMDTRKLESRALSAARRRTRSSSSSSSNNEITPA